MRGERQEPRPLLGEDLRDGVIAMLGMRTLMRDLIAATPKLRVQIATSANVRAAKKAWRRE